MRDFLSGAYSADMIIFGAGRSILSDSLADINGDTIVGLGTKNAVSIAGSQIGRHQFSVNVDEATATLSAGSAFFEFEGNFSGGEFMVVARGGTVDSTTVSFVNHLPSLAEGVRVDPRSINGIANEPFLSGEGSVSFTLQFESAVSEFSNTLGYYRVAADGTILDTHIAFSNTLNVPTSAMTVDLGTPSNGERIGFFLIQDGFDIYGNLPDDLSFLASGGSGPADLDAGLPPILSSASRGVLTVAPVFHSFSTFNPNDAVQVLSGASPGGRDLRIGFEDLPTATGDNDFQDVLISIRTDADGLFIL
jgi:serralysin